MSTQLRKLAVVLTVIGASACADRALTPTEPGADPSLQRAEASELERVAHERAASARAFDSLSVVWANRPAAPGRAGGPAYRASASVIQGVTQYPFTLMNDSLVACEPTQYQATVKTIGPAGGTIEFGRHRLEIPAGALLAPTVITAEAKSSLEVDASLSPHGLVFLRPVRLTLSYKHCGVAKKTLQSVVYLSPSGRILEHPFSVDRSNQTIDALITHFSIYAVAE